MAEAGLSAHWTYTGDDAGLMLFTAALKAWKLPILTGQSVLELGCNETDFLPRLLKADPTLKLTGVDARATDKEPEGWTFVRGSAFDASLFEPNSFDWVISLGALEHFGLGFYGDPKAQDGDMLTMFAVEQWLKPGGSMYFDVPCNPKDEQTPHYRTYAPGSLYPLTRGCCGWLKEEARGYSLPEPNAGTWIPQPTIRREPYHYVALLVRKAQFAA